MASILIPGGLMALMFTLILVGATPLMHGIVEEKMQRIAEVLLGSVRPFELMLGKLLGMAAVSMTLSAVYLGGAYWAVASWYVDGQGGPAFHSNLVQVNPGDVLLGVMTQTGQSGGQFSYYCEFVNIANTGLTISNVQELTWNIETLEAYGCQQCSDYPDANFTAFTGIDFQTAAGRPAISFQAALMSTLGPIFQKNVGRR